MGVLDINAIGYGNVLCSFQRRTLFSLHSASPSGIAIRLRLTFYDASYLQIARKRGLTTLVAEDEKLGERAKRVNIKAVRLNEPDPHSARLKLLLESVAY
jgi:hypothetical protein